MAEIREMMKSEDYWISVMLWAVFLIAAAVLMTTPVGPWSIPVLALGVVAAVTETGRVLHG